jgi:hypothetical protein
MTTMPLIQWHYSQSRLNLPMVRTQCVNMLTEILILWGFLGTLVESHNTENDTRDADLTEEDFILTSTTVYGFSLSDKAWRKPFLFLYRRLYHSTFLFS